MLVLCATKMPNSAPKMDTTRPARSTAWYPNLLARTPATGPKHRPSSAYGVSVAKLTTSAPMATPQASSCAMAGTTPFMMANTPVMVSSVVSSRPHVRRCFR